MNDRQQQKEPIDPVIVDCFTKTLLPVFSWCVSQFFCAMLGYKLTLVLRHPNDAYKRQVRDSWLEGNFLFSSSAEILAFTTSSGRRRARKKLKKIFAPFFRELSRRPEAIFMRRVFQQKLRERFVELIRGKLSALDFESKHQALDMLRIKAKMSDGRLSIPPKERFEIDLGEIEESRTTDFSSYSAEDILETFPTYGTVPPHLTARIESEMGDYPETIRSLLWEASHDWSLMRQIAVKKNSRVWTLLGIDPDNEPDMEQLIDMSLDLALGQADANKLIHLARWVMGKILISQFSLHPYSEKHFTSLGKPIADGLTLGDTLASEENRLPLSDEDRLSQFCELAGIEMDALTDNESHRILDILGALDAGYDFASKQGVSMAAYYGDKADSEKTQRQRLFKKLRDTPDKVK